MNYLQSCLLVLILALPGGVIGADLEVLIENCGGCHGPQGVSNHSDVPTLAGQNAAFLISTMKAFQAYERSCLPSVYRYGDTSRPETNMCKIARELDDQDFEAVSNYYAEQVFVPAPQEFDATQVEYGEQLHSINCESCHPKGGSIPGHGPILAGQWVPYLKDALSHALAGEHKIHPVMEMKFNDFNEREIDALLNYFASQQD